MKTLMESFISKVIVDDCMPGGCHIWTGKPVFSGYGRIQHEQILWRAHRLSYELFKGPIPDGMLIRHTCDVRLCVNPDHLLVGTPQDNSNDCRDRGRDSLSKGTHWQKNKTHCKNGHLFDVGNTYSFKNQRKCRKCNQNSVKKYKTEKKMQ